MKGVKISTLQKLIVICFLLAVLVAVAGCDNPGPPGAEGEEYTLEMNIEGEGKTIPEEGKYTYPEDDFIELEAGEKEDSLFYRWQGETDEKYQVDSEVVMDQDRQVTAVFSPFEGGRYSYDLRYDYQGTTFPDFGEDETAVVLLYSTSDSLNSFHDPGKLITKVDSEEKQAEGVSNELSASTGSEEAGKGNEGKLLDIPGLQEKGEEIFENFQRKDTQNIHEDDGVRRSAEEYTEEDEEDFWILKSCGDQINEDDWEEEQAELEILQEDEGVLLWVTERAKEIIKKTEDFEEQDLRDIVDEFIEGRGKLNDIFGEEPEAGDFPVLAEHPGVNILLTEIEGDTAGYFFSIDLDDSDNYENEPYYSNERKMLYVDAEQVENKDFIPAVIAHEYQHMLFLNEKIQADRTADDSWINEGFSELAMDIGGCGFKQGVREGTVGSYLENSASTSLLKWDGKLENYGASYLFARYLYDVYGTEVIREVSTSPEEPVDVIEDYSGEDFTTVFEDWGEAVVREILATGKDADHYSREDYTIDFANVDSENLNKSTVELAPGETREGAEEMISWGIDYTVISPDSGGDDDLNILVKDSADSGEFHKGVIRLDNEKGDQ